MPWSRPPQQRRLTAYPIAARIKCAGLNTVGLLGTAFTMKQDFYKRWFATRHGLEMLAPGGDDRALVHQVIYEELVQGRAEPIVLPSLSRGDRPAGGARSGGGDPWMHGDHAAGEARGQQGPLFDTTALHAEAAVELAMAARLSASCGSSPEAEGPSGQKPKNVLYGPSGGRKKRTYSSRSNTSIWFRMLTATAIDVLRQQCERKSFPTKRVLRHDDVPTPSVRIRCQDVNRRPGRGSSASPHMRGHGLVDPSRL